MEIVGKNAIVTGATSGIGLEVCRQLLQSGVKVNFIYYLRRDVENHLFKINQQ